MKPLKFTDPIHIVHGASTHGSLRHGFKKLKPEVISLWDSLIAGPCDVDRERHGLARVDFLNSEWNRLEPRRRKRQTRINMEENASVILSYRGISTALTAIPSDRPIVIWSVPTLSDRLSLWWTFDAIDHLGLDRQRIWLCRPRPVLDFEQTEDEALLTGMGCFLGSAFLRGFTDLQQLSSRVIRAGAGLWRRFAGPSPSLFEKACLKKEALFPEVGRLLQYYARLFPSWRRAGSKRMRLSYLDQFILDALSTENWKRPTEVLRADQETFLFLMSLLNGDLWLPNRLLDWAEHDKDNPFVLAREERAGVSPYSWRSYRLTARGEAVRRRGMTSVSDAPGFHIGGCQVYDPGRPWVSILNRANTHEEFSVQ
jgi:Domain of unknown function (DUF1835)